MFFTSRTISTYSERTYDEEEDEIEDEKEEVEELLLLDDTCCGLAVHCATIVTLCAGILSGLGTHPLNVYPSLVGLSG